MGNGGNNDVPREIMAVLPSDPYDQLDLARRITAMAVTEKLSKLESENGKLRAKLAEKDLTLSEMEDRVADAESALQETTSRLSAALDDHSKLTNEKNLLANTVRKLNRDVTKLETFKRTLMQSLQDDSEDRSGGDAIGNSNSFSSVVKASNAAAASADNKTFNGESPWHGNTRASVVEQEEASESTPVAEPEAKHVEMDIPKSQHQVNQAPVPSPTSISYSSASYPASTPYSQQSENSRWQSSTGSPERPPAAERPPPAESKLAVPFSLPSSRATTAPNSPPNANATPGGRTKVDGKEFFRQARNRLSYEQFSSFLANIKELNAHRQTREETLRKADKTFGPENKDLYIAFDGLLSRHLAT